MDIDRVRAAVDLLRRTLSYTEQERLRRYGSDAQVYLINLYEILKEALDTTTGDA